MYSIGDKLVHIPEGVCEIEDICRLEINKQEKYFYKMRSVIDPGKVIYISLDSTMNDRKMTKYRPLMSKEEIQNLLELEPDEKFFFSQNVQKRINIQNQAIQEGDCAVIMKLIKLYMRRRERTRLSVGDNFWLKKAEQFLFSEVAEVMNCEYASLL